MAVTSVKMPNYNSMALALALILSYHLLGVSQGQLRVGFYSQTCPKAESIVISVVKEAVLSNPGEAAILLRLQFHDCFVQGCDGSILIDKDNNSERRALTHQGVSGFETIKTAKAQLEGVCPGVVSCADIVALAARDAVFLRNGPFYEVPTGRRDGRISNLSLAADMPEVSDSIQVLKSKFTQKGFSDQDLVLLSAAHTTGQTACFFMKRRLYKFPPHGGSDPAINPQFLPQLKARCPVGEESDNLKIALDPVSELTFDDQILRNIKNGYAVIESDARLYDDAKTKQVVDSYIGFNTPVLGPSFNSDFAKAMVKMGSIGVKTGSQGEVRRRMVYVFINPHLAHPFAPFSSSSIFLDMAFTYFKMPNYSSKALALALILSYHLLWVSQGQLRVGFYSQTCPKAESIVSSVVKEAVLSNPREAAVLLRLQFHDCFVQGCDGSILINSDNNSERHAFGNLGVGGFEHIEKAKAQLEGVCPGVVSCADIVALAARDAVFSRNGPFYDVPTGRRDGRVSNMSLAADLPDVSDSIQVLKSKFMQKGLSDQDLVLLSAAHTIGQTACFFMEKRLYNFTPGGGSDPAINPRFLPQLKAECPLGGDVNVKIPLDPVSELTFDDQILRNIKDGFAVLESDARLYDDAKTKQVVDSYIGSKSPTLGPIFKPDFAKAMVKMGNIGVKTGSQGEIRRVCSHVN
ncbi:hypothetical protein L1049_026005 [Liquidambar formosana]|uniref:peroxidase n=1 Tax=Liquidambar formosana TaxID=63359 RepID=A0AAP0NE49_LIQFO